MWELWNLLSEARWPEFSAGNGLGPTTISKLMAAKRPRLIPVTDSVIRGALGRYWWEDVRKALGDSSLRAKIEERTSSAPAHVPFLRRIDAVVWYLNR